MKKLAALFLLAFAMLALSSQLALAAAAPVPAPGVGPAGQDLLKFLGKTAEKGGLTTDPNAPTDVTGIISGVINAILGLVGVVFFVMMMYAGIRWMTAEGAEQVIKEAKDTIRSALIGIVIAMSAFLITNFVLNRLESINQGPVPTGNAPSPGAGGNTTIGKCEYQEDERTTGCVNTAQDECDNRYTGAWSAGSCP